MIQTSLFMQKCWVFFGSAGAQKYTAGKPEQMRPCTKALLPAVCVGSIGGGLVGLHRRSLRSVSTSRRSWDSLCNRVTNTCRWR